MSESPSSDPRAEAYQAAARVVDRFLERLGDPVPDGVADLGSAAMDRFRAELARVVDLNLDLVRNAFTLYGSLVDGDAGVSNRTTSPLELSPGVPGSEATGVLWIHNFDEHSKTDVALVGSKLSGTHGEPIEDPEWSFDPTNLEIPSRTAFPVITSVSIPTSATEGIYLGTIALTGFEGQPIDVRLEVVSPGPVPHDTW